MSKSPHAMTEIDGVMVCPTQETAELIETEKFHDVDRGDSAEVATGLREEQF
jgi:hypothetical protein